MGFVSKRAAAIACALAAGGVAQGSVITGLSTASAVAATNDTAGQTITSPTPIVNNSVLPTTAIGTDAARVKGLAMNLTITPTAADLIGVHLLMEIGGNANGTSLVLYNGVPTVFGKQGGTDGLAASVPPPNDTDITDKTFAVQYGGGTALVAGSTYTIAASLAFTGTATASYRMTNVAIGVDDGGLGNAVTSSSFAITDLTFDGINWSGNQSISVKTKSTSAGVGPTAYIAQIGGATSIATSPFYAGTANTNADGIQDFAGATADGYLWNATGAVPEPASLACVAVAGGAVLRRRRV